MFEVSSHHTCANEKVESLISKEPGIEWKKIYPPYKMLLNSTWLVKVQFIIL
jgi:hypothetical protein